MISIVTASTAPDATTTLMRTNVTRVVTAVTAMLTSAYIVMTTETTIERTEIHATTTATTVRVEISLATSPLDSIVAHLTVNTTIGPKTTDILTVGHPTVAYLSAVTNVLLFAITSVLTAASTDTSATFAPNAAPVVLNDETVPLSVSTRPLSGP